MNEFIYGGDKTKNISFPLGGIGTGSIGLLGNGAIGKSLFSDSSDDVAASFFAIKAEKDGKVIDIRFLEQAQTENNSFSVFDKSDFVSFFPFARLNFACEAFPASITLTCFNPFIPLNDADSGIPAAFFQFEVTNTWDFPIDFTLCGVTANPFKQGESKAGCTQNGAAYLCMTDSGFEDNESCPNICISTDSKNISYKEQLCTENGFDIISSFLKEFTQSSTFNISLDNNHQASQSFGALASHFTLDKGESKHIRFLISWYFPKALQNLSVRDLQKQDVASDLTKLIVRKNYYSQYFESSIECCSYCFNHWDRLKADSMKFSDVLLGSTLPKQVIEQVTKSLCMLKSEKFIRLDDGSLCCTNGNGGVSSYVCTQRSNYLDYALCYLFPKLSQTTTDNQLKYYLDDLGGVCFGVDLTKAFNKSDFFESNYCNEEIYLDNQLSVIIKSFCDFKISGDEDELIESWYFISKALDYCFDESNEFCPDKNQSGIICEELRRDIDSECDLSHLPTQLLYLASLKAGHELATVVKDKKRAEVYLQIFEKGRQSTKEIIAKSNCEGALTQRDAVICLLLCDLLEIKDLIDIEETTSRISQADIASFSEFYPVASIIMLTHGYEEKGLGLLCAENENENPFSVNVSENTLITALTGYGLLNAVCGFKYDCNKKHISFSPASDHCPLEWGGTYKCFFCVDGAYGYVEEGIDYIEVNIIYGKLTLRSFGVPRTPRLVQYGGRNWRFSDTGLCAYLDTELEVYPGKKLTVLIDIKQNNKG